MNKHSNRERTPAEESRSNTERRQLYTTVTDLQPIILNDNRQWRVSQATAALYELMARHLAAGDAIDAGFGPVPAKELGHMMDILAHLRALPYGHKHLRQQVFTEFMQVLTAPNRISIH
jgi:hypothetical protein